MKKRVGYQGEDKMTDRQTVHPEIYFVQRSCIRYQKQGKDKQGAYGKEPGIQDMKWIFGIFPEKIESHQEQSNGYN